MLTFNQAQMSALNTVWQTDQLILAMPEILRQLEQKYTDFWSQSSQDIHQRHYYSQAEKLVNVGMSQAKLLEKLLDMEYQYQYAVSKHPWLDNTLKLDWLLAEDRLELIDYFFKLQQIRPLSGAFPYDLLAAYPLPHRIMHIASYPPASDELFDLPMQLPNALRQGLYYALLKQILDQQDGWIAHNSDWKKSLLAIRHPELQRILLLQTGTPGSPDVYKLSITAIERSNILQITLPFNLNEPHINTLINYITAWCITLEPASSEIFNQATVSDSEELQNA